MNSGSADCFSLSRPIPHTINPLNRTAKDKKTSKFAAVKGTFVLFVVVSFSFLWITSMNYIYGKAAGGILKLELYLDMKTTHVPPEKTTIPRWTLLRNNSVYEADSLDNILEKLPVRIIPSTSSIITGDCIKVEDCVTAIMPTHGRLDNVARNINSIRKSLYPDLKIVVVNDHEPVNDAARDGLQYILKDEKVLYKFYPTESRLGIGLGRNLALSFVYTPAFLQLDDDFIFIPETKLDVMLNLLKTTNAVIAGGLLKNALRFDGLIRSSDGVIKVITFASYQKLNSTLYHIDGEECEQVDHVINFFMAKTAEIKNIGGWDEGQRHNEHEEFFIRIKRSGYPVAVCPPVKVYHKSTGYDEKLVEEIPMKSRLYLERFMRNYKLNTYIQCRGEIVKGKSGTNTVKCKHLAFKYKCKPNNPRIP